MGLRRYSGYAKLPCDFSHGLVGLLVGCGFMHEGFGMRTFRVTFGDDRSATGGPIKAVICGYTATSWTSLMIISR